MSSILERIKKELENELIKKVTTTSSQNENAKKEEEYQEKIIVEEDDHKNDESIPESKTTLIKEKIEEQDENTDDITDENEKKYTKVLKKYFGYSKFRPMQMKVIKNIIECKKDQLVVMATGFGKSLCYQFPSLFLNGITIVISPLISLMQDQIKTLK
jgi:Werner syndrome ATP-dependent helicase